MFPATILNTSLVLSLGTLFTEISKILTKFIFFFDADKFVLSFLLISNKTNFAGLESLSSSAKWLRGRHSN